MEQNEANHHEGFTCLEKLQTQETVSFARRKAGGEDLGAGRVR